MGALLCYTGIDGVPTQKRNGVAREFEASGHTVLLAGTGTLNRGVTINGANHVIILNTEWSPETTLQAEDRCHRPGQTKPVHVHYILSANTMEEQMWELLNQKAAAQRAVFDKEALYKSVEEVMSEAVSVQMQVAKAVIEIEREAVSDQPEVQPITHTPESATTHSAPKSYVGAAQLTLTALFQKFGAQGKRASRRKPVTPPKQQLSLFGALAVD
ncbi:MAG: SWF/SNF helicase family protein [Anaerolineae bacterium]|nr:SWF/SNF helicase family protein [Anaerolineae bacterium]